MRRAAHAAPTGLDITAWSKPETPALSKRHGNGRTAERFPMNSRGSREERAIPPVTSAIDPLPRRGSPIPIPHGKWSGFHVSPRDFTNSSNSSANVFTR